MSFSRKILTLAVIVGGLAVIRPTSAEAKPTSAGKFHSLAVKARQRINADGTVNLNSRAAKEAIKQYTKGFKTFRRLGFIPIPRNLQRAFARGRITPAQILARQDYLFALAQTIARANGTGVGGGLLFTPDPATPFQVVNPYNIFELPAFTAGI